MTTPRTRGRATRPARSTRRTSRALPRPLARPLLGALATAGALALLAGCGAPGAQDVLEEHLHAAFRGDCQTFSNTQFFHGPHARRHKLMKACRAGEEKGSTIVHVGAIDQHPSGPKPKKASDTVSFPVEVKDADGQRHTSTMEVVKVDGDWLFWK